MNRERETGLRICKEEFGSIITVYHLKPSGETVVELGNQDAYYFQIKWKLTPSIKHIAKVKNVCRIACTEDGKQVNIRLHFFLLFYRKISFFFFYSSILAHR